MVALLVLVPVNNYNITIYSIWFKHLKNINYNKLYNITFCARLWKENSIFFLNI